MKLGQVVLSVAGRDAGKYFVVVEIVDENHVKIADGDLRRIKTAKLKKIKHIKTSGETLDKIAEKLGWVTVNSLEYLIGAPIAGVEQSDNGVVVTTSPEYSGNTYKIDLDGGQIDCDAQSIIGATVMRHELTQSGDALEFGLLCSDENSDMLTLTITAKSIEISEIARS